nr:MAG TPA: hypothetical protein [Caudoviricetes sp.]DAY08357.1 MAG TPA: hypothetical protein [Caudoviricetes sp.]
MPAEPLKISKKRSVRLKRQRTGPIGRKLILNARERGRLQSMKNKKFGIVVINDDFFLNFCRDFKPPCGYIKPKHARPSYGNGAKPHGAHKRLIRTMEGVRKRKKG